MDGSFPAGSGFRESYVVLFSVQYAVEIATGPEGRRVYTNGLWDTKVSLRLKRNEHNAVRRGGFFGYGGKLVRELPYVFEGEGAAWTQRQVEGDISSNPGATLQRLKFHDVSANQTGIFPLGDGTVRFELDTDPVTIKYMKRIRSGDGLQPNILQCSYREQS